MINTRHDFIPLSVPNLKGNEIKYVTEAIRTEWVSTAGRYVSLFEDSVSEYVHSNGAVACQSGTAGIHLALIACGVREGEEVIVPTLTFIAAVNPVRYTKAEPIFMDCDDSLCMDVHKLKKFCESQCYFSNDKLYNKITNRRIKAIVVVHIFGNMADMVGIMNIARKYNLKVIEDATEAIGTYYMNGEYKGRYAGTIGDVGVYSFNGNKIITSGGGGMVVSNDDDILKKVRHLSTQAKSDEQNFWHDEIGYNYRMTNVQAALGLAQLEQLEDFISIKNANYQYYKEYIDDIEGLRLLDVRDDIRSNRWFYALFIEDEYRMNKDTMIKYMREYNVQVRPVWGLIHMQMPYKGSQSFYVKEAEYYINHVINIPCSTNLMEDDIDYIVDILK